MHMQQPTSLINYTELICAVGKYLLILESMVFRVLAIRSDVTFRKIHNLVTVDFYPKNSTDLKS